MDGKVSRAGCRRWFGMMCGAMLAIAAAEPAFASKATARCGDFEQQLQTALKTHAGPRAAKATALGTQAHKLCSTAQPALGLRTYVKAFRALGVDPDPPKE